MKKALSYSALALVLVVSMGFMVVGDRPQDEKEKGTAYLGVYLGEVTEQIAERYELETTEGVLISTVLPGSAASKAGIMRHDVVVAVDGSPVASVDALREIISQHNPGDVIDVTVVRNGRRQTLAVELGERREIIRRIKPEVFTLKNTKPRVFVKGDGDGVFHVLAGNRYHLGISYQELNKGLGEYFDRPDGDGLLVTDVQEDSAAAKAGLKAGDVIISVDGSKIVDSADLMNALRAKDDEDAEDTKTFQVEIVRRGQTMTIPLEAKLTHGFNYNFKIDRERLERNMQELRENMKGLEHIEFFAPEIIENLIVSMPDMEYLGDQLEFMMPDLDIMLPDLDVMLPDLEMMIPDPDVFIPDIEMMLPHLEFDGEFFDWGDFDDIDISLELKPDGTIIFNGEKFDSMKEFRKFIENAYPQDKRNVRTDSSKAI